MTKQPTQSITCEPFRNISDKLLFNYNRKIELQYLTPVFIHAKNCFNSLALFKGDEFVRQNMFNQFRDCIFKNANWDLVLEKSNKIDSKILLWLKDNVIGCKHSVVIYTEKQSILGFSILYGVSFGLFKIGQGYKGELFSYAVICDFQNGREDWYDSGAII